MSIFFIEQLGIQQSQDDLLDGIKAAVRLHYTEYTDQVELYGPFLEALQKVLDHTYSWFDLQEIVCEVEKEINSEGGVRSDTDGTRHRVNTFVDDD